jgi:N-acetylglucosamine kinase-like BadF-type ATPase
MTSHASLNPPYPPFASKGGQGGFVLGVDAGNTKTIALVANLEGHIVGMGRSGCGDIYGLPDKMQALANVKSAVEQALGIKQNILQACYCMAGADWPDDYDFIESQLRPFQTSPIDLYNDGLGALRAGSPDGYGVTITIGTYVATAARSPSHFWHSSFWQSIAPSGARQLAKDALEAVYRAELEISPATLLKEKILELYQLKTVGDLLYNQNSLNAKPVNVHEGKIARVLLDAAEQQDNIALEILEQHAKRLVDLAIVAVRKVNLISPFNLVLSGGILKHPTRVFKDMINKHFRVIYPETTVVISQREPVLGALMFAFEALGIKSDTMIERLEATSPPELFFET